MPLTSAVLGPASPSKEDTDRDTSPQPPLLRVPMDLRKGIGCKVYNPYSALDDLGVTYNLILQSIAD